MILEVSLIYESFPISCMSTIYSKVPIPTTGNFLLKGRASSNKILRLVLVGGNFLLRGWESCYEWVNLQIIGNDSQIIETSNVILKRFQFSELS